MFAVKWHEDAGEEFVVAWFAADMVLRQKLDSALSKLETDLASDPIGNSESREGTLRIAFALPLGVMIIVDEDANEVRIRHVWLTS